MSRHQSVYCLKKREKKELLHDAKSTQTFRSIEVLGCTRRTIKKNKKKLIHLHTSRGYPQIECHPPTPLPPSAPPLPLLLPLPLPPSHPNAWFYQLALPETVVQQGRLKTDQNSEKFYRIRKLQTSNMRNYLIIGLFLLLNSKNISI